MTWEEHVRRIRADPDSDAPRLVCADWLLERGDPRGEFIAVDCRLAVTPRGSSEWTALHERRKALLDEAKWLAPLHALGAQKTELTRGFVESAQLVGRAAASLSAACGLEPIVDVTLTSIGPRNAATIARAAELRDVRSLTLDGRHLQGIDPLLASPLLGNVRALSIGGNVTGALGAAVASGAARPEHLTAEIDSVGAGPLAASAVLSRLRRLDLRRATDGTMVALASAPLADLRVLGFWESRLTAATFEALGARLDRLEELEMTAAPFDAEIAPVMIRHMTSGSLRRLELAGFSSDAVADLVASPVIAGVEDLELSYGVFTRRVADALRGSAHRSKLRTLFIPDGEASRGFALEGVVVETEGW
jgi:uncharacterized protein (TIGR02996 family)